jgi:hypothetical protein
MFTTKTYVINTDQSLDYCDHPVNEYYLESTTQHTLQNGVEHTETNTLAQFWDKALANEICEYMTRKEENSELTDERSTDEREVCGPTTSEVAKGFVEKFTQAFKKKKEVDWTDSSGKKEFKWSGTCDACGNHKSNLTVVHSATLSGVTICRECRAGTIRD